MVGGGVKNVLALAAGIADGLVRTPVEASLRWALSKARRADGERPGGFPGEKIILRQMAEGAARRRVGLRPEGRAPVREGAELRAPVRLHVLAWNRARALYRRLGFENSGLYQHRPLAASPAEQIPAV